MSVLRKYALGEGSEFTPPSKIPKFSKTGEHRPPRAGEYYLSGAAPKAYKAHHDLLDSMYILEPWNPGTGQVLAGLAALRISEAIGQLCRKDSRIGKDIIIEALENLQAKIAKL